MGTARDFHVKTGLVVDAGNVTLSNGNLLINSGYIDIDNIKIDGQTISTITGDEDINITPHGTGTVVISKVDINEGAVDGTVIGATTAAAGTFAALTGTGLDINGNADISGTTLMSGAISTGGSSADTTITQVNSAANSAGRTLTLQSGSPPSGGTNNAGVGGNLILAGGKGKGTAAGGSILFKVADGASTDGASLNNLATALTIADDKSLAIAGVTSFGVDDAGVDVTFYGDTASNKMLWDTSANRLVITGTDATTALEVADGNVTVADTFTATKIGAFQAIGAIDFNSQAMTNVDVNNGTIDNTTIGISTAVAGNFSTIGATTAGTIEGTTIDATTDFTVGSTVITDDVITFTPSSSDTVTLTAAANAEFTLATADAVGTAGHINLQADGNVRLKYTSATKLETKSTGVDVTGLLEGSAAIHSAYARMRASDGIEDNAGYGSAGTHPVLDVDGTNFYTSETLAVTEVANRSKVPGGNYGTNEADRGNVTVLSLNIENASLDTFQAAEAFCAMSIRDTTGEIQHRVVNKVYGVVNRSGSATTPSIDTIVQFQSGDINVGHFHWVLGSVGLGTDTDTMSLVFKYTSKITHTTNDATTYSVNCNGLSLSGAGG